MTLEQQRAAQAYGHVQAFGLVHLEGSPERKQYASMAQKLPVLLRAAGLCQALHFLRSKSRSAEGEPNVLNDLLEHLAQQMKRTDAAITSGATLCDRVRQADLSQYLWMTREALATAEWYSRLAQSELKVARGEEG